MNFSEAIAEILLGNTEEYEEARKVIVGNISNLAELFGPRIQELSKFRTRLDIEAVEQMQEAGLTLEQAVGLRISNNMAMAKVLEH